MSAGTTQYAWCNGNLQVEDAQLISGCDGAVLYGLGAFTTVRIQNGAPLFWHRHIRRLTHDAKRLGVAVSSEDEITEAARSVVVANAITSGRLRITQTDATLLVTARAGEPYDERYYTVGFRCMLAQSRRDPRSALAGVKSTAYAENLLARKAAKQAGCDESLFLDISGRIAEGSATNVFVVKDGRLYTPSVDTGLLPGIIRNVLLEKLPPLGYLVTECDIWPSDLTTVDEVLLTNSLMGIMPVISVDGVSIGNGVPGPVMQELRTVLDSLSQAEWGWE